MCPSSGDMDWDDWESFPPGIKQAMMKSFMKQIGSFTPSKLKEPLVNEVVAQPLRMPGKAVCINNSESVVESDVESNDDYPNGQVDGQGIALPSLNEIDYRMTSSFCRRQAPKLYCHLRSQNLWLLFRDLERHLDWAMTLILARNFFRFAGLWNSFLASLLIFTSLSSVKSAKISHELLVPV